MSWRAICEAKPRLKSCAADGSAKPIPIDEDASPEPVEGPQPQHDLASDLRSKPPTQIMSGRRVGKADPDRRGCGFAAARTLPLTQTPAFFATRLFLAIPTRSSWFTSAS